MAWYILLLINNNIINHLLLSIVLLIQSLLMTYSEQLWEKGLIQANCQNLARYLTEMPSNHMSPTIFAQVIIFFKKN